MIRYRYGYRRPRRPPPWWPANEAWPPTSGAYAWRADRARFVRRAGISLIVMFVLVGFGLERMLTWAIDGSFDAPLRVKPFLPTSILVIIFVALSQVMRRVGLPMGDIVAAADRVADGDYSVRLPEHGPRSLRAIARAFNSMTSRLQTQEQQRRQLMADIAHELRTPLTVIQGRLEGLIDGVYARDEAQLTGVLNDTRMLARLVEDLRTLAHAESGMLELRKEPTDVGVLLQEVATSFAAPAAEKHVAVETVSAKDLPLVEADPLRIREVVTNLLSNALRHSPAGGTVTLSAEARERELSIAVKDGGSGIAAEDLPRIFDRFYKGAGSHGSGLGLTISKNLVEAHGGRIRAESTPEKGTTITFTLPIQ